MTYAGLTTADKPALLDAKARGAEWVARDGKSRAYDLWFYSTKPVKTKNMWAGDAVFMEKKSARFAFIQWSDPEPVNIDLALAQIAEMESADNPLTWNERINQMTVEEKAQWLRGIVSCEGCGIPKCGNQCAESWRSYLNSPYTEGETK